MREVLRRTPSVVQVHGSGHVTLRADARERPALALAPAGPTAGPKQPRFPGRPESGTGTRKSGGREFPPPLFALRDSAHAAGWLSSLVLSWVRVVLRAVRSSAARIAIAAGSSMRSGSPCLSRERRASSAPALRISARSSGVRGRRGGRRVSRLLSLTFFRACLVGVLSVVGHHFPETTRRNAITSVPLLAKTGWGRNDTHPAERRAISRCNQILTVCSEAEGSRCVIVHRICLCLSSRVSARKGARTNPADKSGDNLSTGLLAAEGDRVRPARQVPAAVP